MTVMCGTHGDETCGIKAVEEILPTLDIEAGSINFIYGNLEAIKRGARFIEMNLNRAFRPDQELTKKEQESYERQRALELVPYLISSAALLDIHSSKTERSTPFLICEPQAFEITKRLLFPIRSCGWDKLEPGGTDYFVNQFGGQGVCAECGYHFDSAAVGRAKKAIIDFLIINGNISGQLPSINNEQRQIDAYFIYRTKDNFVPTRNFDDFEQLYPGEIIGTDGSREIKTGSADYIIFCRRRPGPSEEAFILGK
mgnify:CR=1 FL=1